MGDNILKIARTILTLCFATSLLPAPVGAAPAQADDASVLSEMMLSTLAVDKAKHERAGDFDEVVTALKRGGYIRKRYDAKEDYAEIWKVRKPLDVYGNPVLIVSNEREGKFIGCCMENRTTILVEATGDVGKLREFSKTNGCRLSHDEASDQDSLKETLKKFKLGSNAPKLAELNCSANLVTSE